VAVPKSLAERQAALLGELEHRVQSGWTVVSQSADRAIVERSGETTEITVDEYGALYERPQTMGDEGPPASF
jgi:hypothetical protein